MLITSVAQWNTLAVFDRRVSGQELTFVMTSPGPLTFTDNETGSVWNGKGEAISGPLMGERLDAVEDAFVAFWFAWSIYYPNTRIFH